MLTESWRYKIIIAIDFDGTLCEFAYPKIGRGNTSVIAKVWEAMGKSHTLILWTCREGKYLDAAISWCNRLNIQFDEVNHNCDEIRCRYGDARKICADLYVDDKSPGSIEYFLNMEL